MLAFLLVLLHTLVHSSFAATPAPCNPNKVFASLIYFYTGGSRRLLLCSPAGRCGLIGLSQFLWSLFHVAFAVFILSFRKLHSVIHTATPPHARAVIQSLVSLHSTRSFIPALAFSNPRSKQKLRQPCRVAVGIQHLSVSGYLCLPPSLHSQTARAF